MTAPDTTAGDALAAVLLKHHPIMRSETGPLSGCRCGGLGLGQDVIAHVAEHLRAALLADATELRAKVQRVEELLNHDPATDSYIEAQFRTALDGETT